MRKKDEDVKYCTFCGTKNKSEAKKCKRCKEDFDKKEHAFIAYLKRHIEDKFQGDLTDNLFDVMDKYIRSHLWGVVTVATVIFSIASITINVLAAKEEFMVAEEKPQLIGRETLVCPEGYLLEDDKCVKEVVQGGPTSNDAAEPEPPEIVEPQKVDRCSIIKGVPQRYFCDYGAVLEGSNCVKVREYGVSVHHGCPAGYYGDGSGTNCISSTSEMYSSTSDCLLTDEIKAKYNFPTGVKEPSIKYKDGKCVYSVCVELQADGFLCAKMENVEFEKTVIIRCANGSTLINGECKHTTPVITEYSCNNGGALTSDNRCVEKITEKAKYGCPDGYTLDKQCGVCVEN